MNAPRKMWRQRAGNGVWGLSFAVALLAGCGGGGGDAPGEEPHPVPAPPALADAARPEFAAVRGKYFGDAEPIASRNAFMMIDASGRFLLWNRTGFSGDTYLRYAEDIVIGTLTLTGSQAASEAAPFTHRDAGVSEATAGTARVSMVFGTATTAGRPVQGTLAQTPIAPIGSQFFLTGGSFGYAQAPFAVPTGSFAGGAVRIDGATGRVEAQLAAGCALLGTMSFTDPTVNIARMNATISGSGCADVAYPVGSGEFMGYLFVGANAATGRSIGFLGIVAGRPVSLSWSYPPLG